MSRKRPDQIEREIEKIKGQLQNIQVMRPGSLTRQYRNPQKQTGGFYQLSYTYRMKSKTEYVRPGFVKAIRKQIRDYKRFRGLVERWVALGIEYSRLSMKESGKPSTTPRRKRR